MEHPKEISNNHKITDNERHKYTIQKEKSKFNSPEEEYEWAKSITKTCSKCDINKILLDFKGNTSGTDAFDKDGYRLRRPECYDCTKLVAKGKQEATKIAKQMGIKLKAPEGELCSICNKLGKKGDMLVFDHCHIRNIFRGYCHNSCNRSLGVLGDDIDGMLRAINYLMKTEPCKLLQNDDFTLKKI